MAADMPARRSRPAIRQRQRRTDATAFDECVLSTRSGQWIRRKPNDSFLGATVIVAPAATVTVIDHTARRHLLAGTNHRSTPEITVVKSVRLAFEDIACREVRV
ncbi:MAG TPA: hypothetical protein VF534_20915 [Paraburkholderia sp.]